MGSFYIGCAIWAYKSWIGDLFPPGSKNTELLSQYSQRLTTVEGNTTFYATPTPAVVQRWVKETPASFQFCLKLPRDISHAGQLAMQVDATQAFIERVSPLGPRLGPFFLQLPPAYGPSQIEDLDRWLAVWPDGYRLAVEVRHQAWYAAAGEQALMQLLERHAVGRVLMDVRPLKAGPLPNADIDVQQARDRKPEVPLHPLRSADFSLVRYIGHPTPDLNWPFLDEWAERVASWLAEGTQVYFFMHCPDERNSPSLCRVFQRRLEQRADVPALPWDMLDTGMQQQSLF